MDLSRSLQAVVDRGPAILSALVTLAVAAVLLLMVFETWALWNGHEPITGYVRGAIRAYPPAAFAFAVLIGMVLGHLFWR